MERKAPQVPLEHAAGLPRQGLLSCMDRRRGPKPGTDRVLCIESLPRLAMSYRIARQARGSNSIDVLALSYEAEGAGG